MKTQSNQDKWYEGNTGNHQGLVINEETGENIAVVYDKANTPLIASAPELLEACKLFEDITRNGLIPGSEDLELLQKALAKAEGK